MRLYDNYLSEIEGMLSEYQGKRLRVDSNIKWPDSGNHNMILRSDMAYELGGNNLPAVSGIGFTCQQNLISEDELWLYGPDLCEIDKDQPYARVVVVGLDMPVGEDKNIENQKIELQKAYNFFRKADYEKYHINPKGYMMRISVSDNREPVRIGRKELNEGISFENVGNMFIKEYKKYQEIKYVKMIYITLKDFSYDLLQDKVRQLEKITDSLNYIFNNLKMDCSVCGMKEVCDEVEGLRELHMQ